MSSLSHHGIQGQKWGVRRFQNADGTRTAAGKKRYSVESVDVDSSRKEVKKLVNDFSRKDKEFFFDKRYWNSEYDHDGDEVAKRFVIKEGKNIVAFIDAERGDHHSNESLNIVVGTAQSARGKGYASILSKTMVDWYESEGYKNASMLEWNANKDNIGSRKAAEKAGFKEVLGDEDVGYRYSKNAKKELDELSKARMKTKAIDKEVSDKINSDFKKTRLGKISPNTTITPYGEGRTNWNSELGFYKSMVVDHYATKWAKKNHADDIAKYTKASSDWSSAYSKFDKKRRKAQHTSIGGTMYIEGNALILGDSSYLEHHGILGQRWGVRRFQNKDGTRTAAGKARDQKNAAKKVVLANRRTRNQWQYQNSFTKAQDKLTNDSRDAVRKMAVDALNGERTDEYKTAVEEYDAATNYRYDEYRKEAAKYEAIAGMASGARYPMLDPDKFDQDTRLKWDAEFYMYDDGDQGKYNSYDYFLVAKGENPNKVFDRAMKARNNIESIADKDVDDILGDYKDHPINSKVLNATIKTTAGDALKERIVDMATSLSDYTMVWEHQISYTDDEIKQMKEDIKKYSKEAARLGLTHSAMFIEDGTLYLSHHGIRGQRWGVRRFQNRDGSLTNAGRKRLGYATKGATQTVKKAFKAGVKTGTKAVKAAKAHHEKAEAKKIEKKKEKASKTRAGVSANKDLFTSKELKELNAKFEEQDKLTMARIKHGVEIAKAVGETAKSVGEVGKAYEALTGHKLVPDIVTLQNGGSIDFNNKDKGKDTDKDTDKGKDKAKDKDDDPPKPPNSGGGNPPGNNESGNGPKGNDSKGSKWDDSDLQNQMEAAKKQASKAMKNAKLQEYIDAYNRDQNSEKNKELTARGRKAIEILSKGGGFTSEEPKSPTPPTPKSAPSSNNLMAQIRAAQAKLEKPNKNETPAEHKEAQEKVNALEKIANQYKSAANKPGTDPAEVAEKLLKKNKDILDDLKHMDFSDTNYLEHHGVRGMKWGKHLMAGKGGGIYDGTALGAGGGGGAMTEEERKKAEELRKKKLEEAKKKAEEAAKEKEIEKKAKEIGISAKAYKRYSIDNNRLPGKRHYDKSQKLYGEASSSVAEAQAAERQAHMNRAKAASLMRKVNSSHMFDADGYHISQQRGDDRKEAKRLQKEAKQLDKKSKKALKKFYKKRYKSDKERQKWQNSTSGKYHHMMRHYEIQNGTLFIDAGDPYLEHHGVLGMKWGKHLRAGKGPADAPASAGGGGGEDDEKLKEMAKKAGMSVAEYKQKFASKIGGAASKVGEKVYDAAGGSHKKNAEGWRKMAQEESNAARASERSSHENSARAASQDRKYGSGGDVYRRAADSDKENAETHRSNAKGRSERAASEQEAYEKSLAGKYDKMKADRARSKKIKQRQSIERALSNGPVEAKPKKGLGKRLEEKLGVTHEKTNKPKQSKEAKRIENMYKEAARRDGIQAKRKKQISNARDSVEKASRSNENAYKHAKAVYRQTGSDSDAYKQAIKRSGTTLQRYIDSKKLLKKKKRAKHSDDTNAVYTEGTKLVINSKWG